ncbi:MAG: branched-chain amino acid ABC transporter permease [Actinomycetota bacterium]|nr:branched-chain amino acid ABC transporter permease [Actinomycetota bacterium]
MPAGQESYVRKLFIALVLTLVGGLLGAGAIAGAGPAAADGGSSGEDKLSINAKLIDTSGGKSEPVAGVDIVVTGADGEAVGTATTDDEGIAAVPIPQGGEYTVSIDTNTLPENTFLTDPDRTKATVNVLGFDATVQFPIGPDTRNLETWVDRLPDLLMQGIKFGLLIALAALGLSMIYGTTGLTNFAHGELVTLGGILTWTLNRQAGLPVLWAGVLTVIIMAGVGALQDLGFWRPLRNRGSGNIALMIVSIGFGLFLRNVYQYFFGDDTRAYSEYTSQGPLDLPLVEPTPKDLVIIAVAIAVLVVVSLLLARTRLGKATRAVADNPSLAASSGINVAQVITVVWIAGTALAGLSGVLLGVDQQVEYQMGFKILLLVFAGVTLGGLGTVWGAMLGSLIVGIMIEMSTLVVPAELKYVGALVLLILILLVRPQGILGRRERVG